MDILDFEFLALLALLVAAITQTVKRHPKINNNNVTYVSAVVGILMSYLWYAAKGDFASSRAWLGVDWMNVYRAFSNGIVATTTAWIGYNAQKAAPIPNLLPTVEEMDEKRLQHEVTKTHNVVEAVSKGVEPDKAKNLVGLDENDPPPNEELEKIKPELPIPTDETIG